MAKEKNSKIGMIGTFIVAAIAYIVIGVFMVMNPKEVVNATIIVFGIGMLLYGIINVIIFFVNKDQEANLFMEMAIGVIAIGIGVFALLPHQRDLLEKILFYSIGAILIIDGLCNFKRAFSLKSMGFTRWYVMLAFAAIGLILGIICVLLYNQMGKVIIVFVGIALIYEGVASLITMLMVALTKKKVKKEIMRVTNDDR